MRAALIALVVLLLPAALFAEGTVGVFFSGGAMTYSPAQFEEFNGYVMVFGQECYVNAAEFDITLPTGIQVTGFSIPDGSLSLGGLPGGLSITYWPPLNGFDGEAHLLCTLNFLAKKACGPNGIQDGEIIIVADQNAVPTPGVLATCWPDNEIHFLTGLKSIICPHEIAVESKSWGSIKSLYDK